MNEYFPVLTGDDGDLAVKTKSIVKKKTKRQKMYLHTIPWIVKCTKNIHFTSLVVEVCMWDLVLGVEINQ